MNSFSVRVLFLCAQSSSIAINGTLLLLIGMLIFFYIVLLAKAGKLSLDDDIRPYLPEMHGFGKKITGEFYSAELETRYRLQVQDGKLVALHQRNDTVSLTPTVTDQFAGNQWWFRGVQIQRNAQGAIAGFTITGGRVRYHRFVKRA